MNRSIDRRRDLPRIDHGSTAEIVIGKRRVRCAVENTSPNGAGLRIDSGVLLPQQFQLIFGGQTLTVVVMWRQGERLGVCFAPNTRS